jgi:hypothetical protein
LGLNKDVPAPFTAGKEEIMKSKNIRSYLSRSNREELAKDIKAVPEETRAAFEKAFADWKASWFRGGLAINSNPYSRAVRLEYDRLIALGSAIIPLVIERLSDPESFLALQLYDAIQPDPKLVVYFEPDDERILEGEQGRARRVVRAWFANR